MDNKSCCSSSESCSSNKCGITCPITGFCLCFKPRFTIAAVIMIIWVNAFAWFWHTVILSESYKATAQLWRGPDQMCPFTLTLGLSLMAFIATYIFKKGYEGTGWREGLRFGILVTLFLGGLGLVNLATQPIPGSLIGMWILGDFITYTVGGIFLCRIFGGCFSQK